MEKSHFNTGDHIFTIEEKNDCVHWLYLTRVENQCAQYEETPYSSILGSSESI